MTTTYQCEHEGCDRPAATQVRWTGNDAFTGFFCEVHGEELEERGEGEQREIPSYL